jgi:hypothetical protein
MLRILGPRDGRLVSTKKSALTFSAGRKDEENFNKTLYCPLNIFAIPYEPSLNRKTA